MKIPRSIITARSRIAGITLAAAALLAMTGCVNDDSPCLPDKDAMLTMEFSIVTRGARAGDRSATETRVTEPANSQIGTAAENYLDIPNMAFLLFDADRKLITTFYPEVTAEGNIYKKYNVICRIPQGTFDYAVGDDVTFYIMVLANYKTNNPSRINFTPGIGFDPLFNMQTVGTCNFPLTRYADNPNYWWSPDIDHGQYIPMSGMRRFTVTKAQLLASNPTNPLQLSSTEDEEINMLRTVAKIEIVDRIQYDEATNTQPALTNRIAVEKVELLGYFDKLSILPTLANWQPTETDYVQTPSIPSTAVYHEPKSYAAVHPEGDGVTPETQNQNVIIDFFYDETATQARADKCRVFSTYVSEYDNAMATNGGKTPAWMAVTIMVNNVGDQESNPVFEVKLAPYANNVPGTTMNLLRNNIYRYEINSASMDMHTDITYTVCPFDDYTINPPIFE